MTREERADQFVHGVVRRIGAMQTRGEVPAKILLWPRAHEIVGPAQREYLEGERRFLAGELDEEAMGRLAKAVLNAWQEAGRAAKEKIRQRHGG